MVNFAHHHGKFHALSGPVPDAGRSPDQASGPPTVSTTTTILALGCDGSQGEAVLRGLRHHISRYDLPWLLTTEVPTHMLPHLLGSRQRFVGGQPRPDAIVGFIRHDLDPDLLRRHPLPVASCSAAKPPTTNIAAMANRRGVRKKLISSSLPFLSIPLRPT